MRELVGRSRDGVQRCCVLSFWNSFGELQQRQIGLGVGRSAPRGELIPCTGS